MIGLTQPAELLLALVSMALQAACIFYVGVRLLLPGQDAGIDFAREYELAKGMEGADP